MLKLKNIQKKYGMLSESYAWERQEGKPLPTLKDVQEKYNAKSVNEQGNDKNPISFGKSDLKNIDIDASLREIMKSFKEVVRINRTSANRDISSLQTSLQTAIEKSTTLYGEISAAYQQAIDASPGDTDLDNLEDNPFGI